MLMIIYILLGILCGIITVGTAWATSSANKKRRLRQRFFVEALGSPAIDGLPIHLSLFQRMDQQDRVLGERMDQQDRVLAEVQTRLRNAGLLNGKGDRLISDVNGLRADLTDFIADRRAAETSWRTALNAQNINVPPDQDA